MSISLTFADGSTVDLPADLMWEDEFNWTPVSQAQSITVTGSLIVEEHVQKAGRPITLVGGDNASWIKRSTLESLYAKAQNADEQMTLTLNDGTAYSVMWRHGDTPIEAGLVQRIANPGADDYYTITLRFMEV